MTWYLNLNKYIWVFENEIIANFISEIYYSLINAVKFNKSKSSVVRMSTYEVELNVHFIPRVIDFLENEFDIHVLNTTLNVPISYIPKYRLIVDVDINTDEFCFSIEIK